MYILEYLVRVAVVLVEKVHLIQVHLTQEVREVVDLLLMLFIKYQ